MKECPICGIDVDDSAWVGDSGCCCECDQENRKNIKADEQMDLEKEDIY